MSGPVKVTSCDSAESGEMIDEYLASQHFGTDDQLSPKMSPDADAFLEDMEIG